MLIGVATLIMAFFYGVVEMLGYRRWTFPFVVVRVLAFSPSCVHQSVEASAAIPAPKEDMA